MAETIINMLDPEPGLLDTRLQIFGIIHLAIAISHSCKIQRGHGQSQCRRYIFLPIPQSLHNIYSCLGCHHFSGPVQNAYNLVHAEAIQKLAHPNSIDLSVRREMLAFIQKIYTITVNTIGSRVAQNLNLHHLDLLRKVQNGNPYLFVIIDTTQCPPACITSHIEQPTRLIGTEDNTQGLVERVVAIKMVKGKPRLLHLLGQRGQAFIDSRPLSKMRQAFGLSLKKRIFQPEPPFVIDILVKIYIDTSGRVYQQKPSCLGQLVTIRIHIGQNKPYTERCFQQAFHGIVAQTGTITYLFTGQPDLTITQHLQDTIFQHNT